MSNQQEMQREIQELENEGVSFSLWAALKAVLLGLLLVLPIIPWFEAWNIIIHELLGQLSWTAIFLVPIAGSYIFVCVELWGFFASYRSRGGNSK